LIAVLGVGIVIASVREDKVEAITVQAATNVEAPATIPPPTTAPPSTTSLPPGDTLPAGPTDRPTGLVAGAFWDALTKVGVDPGIARCAADDLLANTSEADLLAMGIAAVPRPPEVNALLDSSAKRCGVTQAQLDAAAAA
jgi:hypothetical protein